MLLCRFLEVRLVTISMLAHPGSLRLSIRCVRCTMLESLLLHLKLCFGSGQSTHNSRGQYLNTLNLINAVHVKRPSLVRAATTIISRPGGLNLGMTQPRLPRLSRSGGDIILLCMLSDHMLFLLICLYLSSHMYGYHFASIVCP